jgi:hypothetical protein
MSAVDDAEACIAIAVALHDDEFLAASVAALREAKGGFAITGADRSFHPLQSARKFTVPVHQNTRRPL